MPEKPRTAAEYQPEQMARVRATCLYLATKLGDLMDDLVVVGGLAPSLLIDQTRLPEGASAYVGTMDLDLGLAFAVVVFGGRQHAPGNRRSYGGPAAHSAGGAARSGQRPV